jgi:hypothetical protein
MAKPYELYEAGEIIEVTLIDSKKLIKLSAPPRPSRGGGYWVAPGYRWIKSKKKFSTRAYDFVCSTISPRPFAAD